MSRNDEAHMILLETIEYLHAMISVLEHVVQDMGVPYAFLTHKYDQRLAQIRDKPDEIRDFIFGKDLNEY